MPNGDAAFAAGLPVADPDSDLRLGYDDINAVADALARIITSVWRRGVNTTEEIATTGNIEAAGYVSTNTVICKNHGGFYGNVDISGHTTSANGLTASFVRGNADVYIGLQGEAGSFSVSQRLAAIERRIAALEAKP